MTPGFLLLYIMRICKCLSIDTGTASITGTHMHTERHSRKNIFTPTAPVLHVHTCTQLHVCTCTTYMKVGMKPGIWSTNFRDQETTPETILLKYFYFPVENLFSRSMASSLFTCSTYVMYVMHVYMICDLF